MKLLQSFQMCTPGEQFGIMAAIALTVAVLAVCIVKIAYGRDLD